MYLCKFGQIHSLVQKIKQGTEATQTLAQTPMGSAIKPIYFSLGIELGAVVNINLLIYVNQKSVHMVNLLISLLVEYNCL